MTRVNGWIVRCQKVCEQANIPSDGVSVPLPVVCGVPSQNW